MGSSFVLSTMQPVDSIRWRILVTSHLFTWPLQPCPSFPFYLISYQENLVLKPMFAGIQDITLQRNNGEDPGSAPAVIFRIRPFVQPLNTVPSLCTVCFTVHGGRVGTTAGAVGSLGPPWQGPTAGSPRTAPAIHRNPPGSQTATPSAAVPKHPGLDA